MTIAAASTPTNQHVNRDRTTVPFASSCLTDQRAKQAARERRAASLIDREESNPSTQRVKISNI
jgi:hypothetical protein